GDRAQRAVAELAYPRYGRAIAEAQHQLDAHGHAAALADHDAHKVRVGAADRHEIDQRDRALVGLEAGFEDQRVGAIAARRVRDLSARRDAEAPMFSVAEQS